MQATEIKTILQTVAKPRGKTVVLEFSALDEVISTARQFHVYRNRLGLYNQVTIVRDSYEGIIEIAHTKENARSGARIANKHSIPAARRVEAEA